MTSFLIFPSSYPSVRIRSVSSNEQWGPQGHCVNVFMHVKPPEGSTSHLRPNTMCNSHHLIGVNENLCHSTNCTRISTHTYTKTSGSKMYDTEHLYVTGSLHTLHFLTQHILITAFQETSVACWKWLQESSKDGDGGCSEKWEAWTGIDTTS